MVLPDMSGIHKQQQRLFDCINRFVRAEDAKLTDAHFIETVYRRWLKDRDGYIGDVGDGVDLKASAR